MNSADCEAADNAAVVAAKLADAINAGCASSGYAAVAEANILTISAPSDFECCFATADMIPSCGLGVSLSNECSVNNVCNGVSCDEIAPHTSGLQFMKIMGPVPAVLQSYSSYWSGTHVEVTWRLTGADGWLDFDVFRREGSSEVFTRLNQNAVRRESHEFVFQDRFVERGKRYIYRVVIREDGEAITSFETTVDAPEVTFRLEQNHPNPFNPTTSIPFSVSRSERVVLAVYDASGRHITTLIDRDMVPGEYSEEWDGRDAHGNAVATGVYMIRLRQGQTALTRKAVLLK
jgi:hypothetical protein